MKLIKRLIAKGQTIICNTLIICNLFVQCVEFIQCSFKLNLNMWVGLTIQAIQMFEKVPTYLWYFIASLAADIPGVYLPLLLVL